MSLLAKLRHSALTGALVEGGRRIIRNVPSSVALGLLIVLSGIFSVSYASGTQLFGVENPSGGRTSFDLVEINTSTGHATPLFEFSLLPGAPLADMTFHSPTGRFLLSRASVTGGSLVVLDPLTHLTSEFSFTGLPAGLTSTQGIAYDPILNSILITIGPTGTFIQNRIAEVSLTGVVQRVSAALNVPDMDELAFNPATQKLDIADFNQATGVQTISDVFGTSSLTPIAPSAFDNNLGYPAFSDTGQLFLARLGSRELFTLSGNNYVAVGPFDTSTDVQALAFAPPLPTSVPQPASVVMIIVGAILVALCGRPRIRIDPTSR